VPSDVSPTAPRSIDPRPRAAVLLVLLMLGLQASVLVLMGQPMMSASGTLTFWNGAVLSAENSQQVTDWYTFTHVLHGFLFYFVLARAWPGAKPIMRLLAAVGLEVAWECFENTPWLIEHYRQQALAMGYSGDSVINSLADTAAAAIGFLAAWRLPVVVTILAAFGVEILLAVSIHDGLTLNIINLIYPFEFIKIWQMS